MTEIEVRDALRHYAALPDEEKADPAEQAVYLDALTALEGMSS